MREERAIWTAVRQFIAVLWLVLLLTTRESGVVWRWFGRWLARSPENRAEFLRVESLWGAIRAIRRSSVWQETSQSAHLVERGGARVSLRAITIAALTVICVTGLVWYLHAGKSGEAQDEQMMDEGFATDAGHQEIIRLSDNSEVTLNANSSVYVKITEKERRVYLEKGTALFKVSKDAKNRPFDVIVGDSKVRAVGTIFAVSRKSDQVAETIVTQGCVAIYSKEAEIGRLRAGETGTVAEGNLQRQKPQPSKVDARLAWATGQIEFQGESLAQAVADINSLNKRQIAIADPAIETLSVGGVYPQNDPDAFAAMVASSLRLRQSLDPVGSNGAGTIYLQSADLKVTSVPSTGSQVVGKEN